MEYEEKSSVEKCINAFRQFNGVIGDNQDPENLKSVIAYVKEQEDLENQEENQHEIKEEGKDEVHDDNNDKESKKELDDKDSRNKTKTETDCTDEAEISTSNEQRIGVAPKRAKEDSAVSDSEDVPHAKRLKTESETEQDKEGQGSTTDEKASVTDENQDQQQKK